MTIRLYFYLEIYASMRLENLAPVIKIPKLARIITYNQFLIVLLITRNNSSIWVISLILEFHSKLIIFENYEELKNHKTGQNFVTISKFKMTVNLPEI